MPMKPIYVPVVVSKSVFFFFLLFVGRDTIKGQDEPRYFN